MIKRLLALALFVLALASASLAHSAPKTEIAYASTKDIRTINPHSMPAKWQLRAWSSSLWS